MSHRIALVFGLTASCLIGSVSTASAETWTWFRSATTNSEWWTTGGHGDVNFSGGAFKATLLDGGDRSVRLSLRGSVAQGVVTALVCTSRRLINPT